MTPKYPVDDETRALLEDVLSMAQRVADLQYDDDVGDDLQAVLVEVAHRFGIPTTEVNVSVSDEGVITATVSEPETPRQPLKDTRPKLVTVDGVFREPLPPGFSQDKPEE